MKKKILLIEDNEDHKLILKTYLEAEDYDVLMAENGLSATRILATQKIDLIVLDLWMPSLDGLSFLKGMRSHPNWEKIPVIVTTGMERTEGASHLTGLKVDEFFTKPYEPEKLVSAVGDLLLVK